MRVPDLEDDIYQWEVKELRWTTVMGVEMCRYCHKEKHEHIIETDRHHDGRQYYICLAQNYPDHAYPRP